MIWILLALSIVGWSSGHSLNQSTDLRNSTLKDDESFKGRQISNYVGMISCVANYDVSCFLDVAQDYLELKRTELLVEADAEALKSTGRADPDAKPSYLAELIGKLIKEFGGMFRGGFGGFLQSREGEDDDDTEDSDEEDDGDSTEVSARSSTGVSEMRTLDGLSQKKKKKKKKPLKSLIRLIKVALIALIIVLKLGILLKVLQTAMQFKFLLISVATFAIQAFKFWTNLKNKNDHHEEIVYKNPYLSGDEYSSPGGGSSYGGEYNAARNFPSAQHMAYSHHAPM
ncbi:uncharacterized protein LOC143195614 isoform X2 [Rhynchophorus ferrugineus]|uniref:uncharacterized protein LOC143195614 isoform X2 n=1 Tax=Rhynchophorus ferrugineus TaxID=354439 RepID=UPI003FCC664C